MRESPSTVGLPPLHPRWVEPTPPSPDAVARLQGELKLPRALCAVLAARGLEEPDDAKRFLRPLLDHLHDPALLADGSAAARRIARATSSGEVILVHGDYDVDGICATALYTRWLRRLGGRVVPFVPHRLRDGYDFGDAGLAAARDAGAGLILTADCGTVAGDAVARAREEGRDVVVTDHHTVGETPAPATFLVNPRRPDCDYPDPDLCGAGVAYKVCELVARELGVEADELSRHLDLVALATVADLVPLQGENRVLVRHGLRRFAQSANVGLRALLEVSEVAPDQVSAGMLGYRVGPRINAAGRLGESAEALRLLLTDDRDEALRLARRLDELNQDRRDEDGRTLEEVLERLSREFDPKRDFGVVLAGEGWHPGVIGIVASRVVERIHRPTVLLAMNGEVARGSARSIPGFHLYDALATCRPLLRRFGGHAQAAGMDVDRERVTELREAFNAEARRRLADVELRPRLRSDLDLPLPEASLDLVHWLSYLGPHGIGNPGPTFLARGVRVHGARVVGEDHLKARLAPDDGSPVEAIGFGMAGRHPPEQVEGRRVDVLLRLERNEWRGTVSLQARLLDLRLADGTDAGGARP